MMEFLIVVTKKPSYTSADSLCARVGEPMLCTSSWRRRLQSREGEEIDEEEVVENEREDEESIRWKERRVV
jgi:hypothetical protein